MEKKYTSHWRMNDFTSLYYFQFYCDMFPLFALLRLPEIKGLHRKKAWSGLDRWWLKSANFTLIKHHSIQTAHPHPTPHIKKSTRSVRYNLKREENVCESEPIVVIHWLHRDVAAQRKLQDHTSGTAWNPVKLLKWSRVGALGGANHRSE